MRSGRKLKTLPLRVMTIGICLVALLLVCFFFTSLNMAEEKLLHASGTLLALVDDNIVSATQDLRSLAVTIAYNAGIQRSLVATQYADLVLNTGIFYEVATVMMKTNNFIDDVAVFTPDFTVFRNVADTSTISYTDYKKPLADRLGKIAAAGGGFVVVPAYEGEWYFSYVLPIRELRDQKVSGGQIGYCLVTFSLPRVSAYSRRILAYEGSLIGVVMNDGTIIPSGLDRSRGVRAALANPGRYLVDSRRIEGFGCTLYSFIPKSEIVGERVSYLLLAFSLLAVLLGILAVIGLEFAHAFSVPLDELTRQLAAIDGSDADLRVASMPENEIGEIARSINRMLDKIHDLVRREREQESSLHELELAGKQAELAALHSQINPHFLHNTLECIRSIALDFRAEQIVAICTSLADVLSYSLARGEDVPLWQEVEAVERYLEIIAIRFDGRYRFAVHVDDAVRTVVIPRMILQPIVENAVYHGLEKCREGSLEVAGAAQDGILVIKVTDTGAGMDAAFLAALRLRLERCAQSGSSERTGERGIGLANTHCRIARRYGSPYGVTVESREGAGTEVTIRIPRQS